MFKILYLFHVRHEYAVTMINPRQRRGQDQSHLMQHKNSSGAQEVGALPACLRENNSHNSYHLCSKSIPLFSLHINCMRQYCLHTLEEELHIN